MAAEAPSTVSPRGTGLFVQVAWPGHPIGAGHVFLVLSFQAPELGGLDVYRLSPSSLLGQEM